MRGNSMKTWVQIKADACNTVYDMVNGDLEQDSASIILFMKATTPTSVTRTVRVVVKASVTSPRGGIPSLRITDGDRTGNVLFYTSLLPGDPPLESANSYQIDHAIDTSWTRVLMYDPVLKPASNGGRGGGMARAEASLDLAN